MLLSLAATIFNAMICREPSNRIAILLLSSVLPQKWQQKIGLHGFNIFDFSMLVPWVPIDVVLVHGTPNAALYWSFAVLVCGIPIHVAIGDGTFTKHQTKIGMLLLRCLLEWCMIAPVCLDSAASQLKPLCVFDYVGIYVQELIYPLCGTPSPCKVFLASQDLPSNWLLWLFVWSSLSFLYLGKTLAHCTNPHIAILLAFVMLCPMFVT